LFADIQVGKVLKKIIGLFYLVWGKKAKDGFNSYMQVQILLIQSGLYFARDKMCQLNLVGPEHSAFLKSMNVLYYWMLNDNK